MSRTSATRSRSLIPLDFLWTGDAGGFNPADSTTYFSGMFAGVDPSTSETGVRLTVPFNCIVRAATITTFVGGTVGSGESSTFAIRANAATDSTLSSSITFNAANNTVFNVTGLAISLTKGDQLQLKVTTPAWVTNPTVVLYQTTLLVEAS